MISFLICAFNEEKYIKATIETLYESINKVKIINNFEIIVVNDGSSDQTEKIVLDLKSKDKNINYCKNEKNLGLGQSIKRGLKQIKYSKFMIIPGDNDLSVEAISSGLKNVNSADLVMLFPVNIDNRSKIRNIVSILYKLFYLIFFDSFVNYINSPSICPTEKVRNLELRSNRFSIMSEIITKLLHSDITYCELPFFFNTASRKRDTITIKNLFDVIFSFIKLFLEMKITNRSKFKIKSKRKNVY